MKENNKTLSNFWLFTLFLTTVLTGPCMVVLLCSLCCEHTWLTDRCRSHLSGVRCCLAITLLLEKNLSLIVWLDRRQLTSKYRIKYSLILNVINMRLLIGDTAVFKIWFLKWGNIFFLSLHHFTLLHKQQMNNCRLRLGMQIDRTCLLRKDV